MNSFINVIIFEVKLLFRTKQRLLFSFLFPALILLIFVSLGRDFPGYPQFILPGLIAWVALSNSVHAISPVIGAYKAGGVLKRVRCSPLRIWRYALGFVLSRFVLILIAMSFLILLGIVAYHVRIRGNPINLFLSLALGILSFMAVGTFISSLFKSGESIGVVTNLFVYLSLFLSNAFWPLDMYPKTLVTISKFLPLTHMTFLFRAEMNGTPLTTPETIKSIGIIIAWTLCCFIIGAIRIVKAEED